MGLVLSVLVFCVGVVEGLDCWRHLLLHLIQPQYNPLPCHEHSREDDLTEGGRLPPSEELRVSSHVDICWPKDLSPDDVHILKKLKHSDSERNESEDHADCRKSSPQIVVHAPETKMESPLFARESSPNHLELSVIIESDSSSEIDEPSQIENPAYRRNRLQEATTSHHDNKVVDEIRTIEKSFRITPDCDDEVVIRESCPSAQEVEEICDYESELEQEHVQDSPSNMSELPNASELPVFTDSIISQNVMKVSCRYPSGGNADNTNTNNVGFDNHSESKVPLTSIGQLSFTSDQLIPLKTDIMSPEIRLSESSPLSLGNSSDSSMSTGDASAMVKSKTSDRPLVVVLPKSPKAIEDEFISVTKTDLQALGKADIKMDYDNKDIYFDAQTYEENKPKSKDLKEVSKSNILDENKLKMDVTSRSEGGNDLLAIDGGVEEKKRSETNSSSSSLSGIPQLPEDSRGGVTPLPTDNGYEHEHPEVLKESCDSSDRLVESLPTDDSSKQHHVTFSLEVNDPSTEDKDVFKSGHSSPNIVSKNTETDMLREEDKFKCEHSSSNIASRITETDVLCEEDEFRCEHSSSNIASRVEETEALCEKELEKELKSLALKHKDSLALPRPGSRNASTQSDNGDLIETSTQTEEFNVKYQSEEEISRPQPHSPKDSSGSKSDAKTFSKTSSEIKPSTAVVLCQAKKTSEEDHVRNRADSVSARISPPPPQSEKPGQTAVANPGPSTSEEGATASTSKADHPEDKAFWLIFSGEYTKAMNKDWHSGHFCCWQCDESLTGQRYVLRDEHPYCIKCYESVFANGCEECNKTIGIDSKDLSYKDKHWHEACFLCNKCRISLVDKQFGSKLDKIFCGNCYDSQFASRCDGCGQIFKAGTKKMEYKTRQWHEPCFACCVCKSAIGTKSFIPREQEIYCATCYEEKFATRCVKCNKIITSGGVTYKNEPWHRECFTCTNCNTSLAGQRFTSRDEKPYCADCFGELFAKRCTACCKPITGIGGTRFISFEDRHWHNDCFICASCKTSLVGRGFITDGDDIICPECAKQKLM